MNTEIKKLKLPLSADEARDLKLGDIVTLSGLVFTGRSRLHIRAIEQDIVPPIDFEKINCFFHVGPVMKKSGDTWEICSIEPTSSIRFERYSPALIRKLNLHVLVGKTTMGPATAAALAKVGGVHLSKIGICGNMLKKQVKRVCEVHFLEKLGKTEATWIFEVENFGPFFVDIDAHGNNYFESLDNKVQNNLQDAYKKMGISPDYEYTKVNP